jgi:transposase-like protein
MAGGAEGPGPGTGAFLAEAFLAGLSTRDLARISEKHMGQKYDSKQVSRIVARAATGLEAWRQQSLQGQHYKFLYLDGANFRVRINGHVSVQSFVQCWESRKKTSASRFWPW